MRKILNSILMTCKNILQKAMLQIDQKKFLGLKKLSRSRFDKHNRC